MKDIEYSKGSDPMALNVQSTVSKKILFLAGFLVNCPYLFNVFNIPLVAASIVYPLSFLLVAIATKGTILFNKKYIVFTLYFVLYYVASYALFPKNDYANYKISSFIVKIIPLLYIGSLLRFEDRKLQFLRGYLTSQLLFTLVVFLIVVQNFASYNINVRLEIGELNPIWIIRTTYELILIYFLFYKRDWKLIVLILLSLPILYATGSKGPILSFLLVLLVLFWPTIRLKYRIIILILFSLSAIYIVHLSIQYSDSYIVQRFLRVVPDQASENFLEESRGVVWPITFEKLQNTSLLNFLFGHGVGNFGTFYFDRLSHVRYYPHNILLELFVEQGLVFVIVFCFALFYLWKFQDSKLKYLMLYTLINAMFSGDIILNELVFLYMGMLFVKRKSTE